MISVQNTRRAVSSQDAVHGLFLLASLACAILAAGCSIKSFDDIRPGIGSRGHYIEDVPFVRQGDSDCGPAALAAVFAYWKRPVEVSQITSRIYLPTLQGTLPMDMERYAKEAGFHADAPPGNRETLLSALRTGQPVICMLDLGFGPYRQPHYVTVIGFDDVNSLFIMHDGEHANRTIRYDDFESAWSRAGHWALAVTLK